MIYNKLVLIVPAFIATVLGLGTFTVSGFAQSDGANQTMQEMGQSANQTGEGMQQGLNKTGEAIQGNASDIGAKITEGAKSVVGEIGEKLEEIGK